jgi:hypothetical protein
MNYGTPHYVLFSIVLVLFSDRVNSQLSSIIQASTVLMQLAKYSKNIYYFLKLLKNKVECEYSHLLCIVLPAATSSVVCYPFSHRFHYSKGQLNL